MPERFCYQIVAPDNDFEGYYYHEAENQYGCATDGKNYILTKSAENSRWELYARQVFRQTDSIAYAWSYNLKRWNILMPTIPVSYEANKNITCNKIADRLFTITVTVGSEESVLHYDSNKMQFNSSKYVIKTETVNSSVYFVLYNITPPKAPIGIYELRNAIANEIFLPGQRKAWDLIKPNSDSIWFIELIRPALVDGVKLYFQEHNESDRTRSGTFLTFNADKNMIVKSPRFNDATINDVFAIKFDQLTKVGPGAKLKYSEISKPRKAPKTELTITALNSYPPIFFYKKDIVKSDDPKLKLNEGLRRALGEGDAFFTKAKEQSKHAAGIESSEHFDYDTLDANYIPTGFSFGRYHGALFRPYPADDLIAFAVTAKQKNWPVTRLYPHWSAAADFVDRTDLPEGDTPIRTMQLAYSAARVEFAFTGFSPGVIPNEEYHEALFDSDLNPEADSLPSEPSLDIPALPAGPPKTMYRVDSLQECFDAIGGELPLYEFISLPTIEKFIEHARSFVPTLQVQQKSEETRGNYHFLIDDTRASEGYFWGKTDF